MKCVACGKEIDRGYSWVTLAFSADHDCKFSVEFADGGSKTSLCLPCLQAQIIRACGEVANMMAVELGIERQDHD